MSEIIIPGRTITESDSEYLKDESGYKGMAESISFPENREEVVQIISNCLEQNIPVTLQGARTGITGAGVPAKGHVLGMQNLNGITVSENDGVWIAKVEAGATVQQLKAEVRKATSDQMVFPTIPTEETATLGGVAASGSGGIFSFGYGKFKDYVEEITVLLGNGEIKIYKKDDQEMEEILGSEGMKGVILDMTLRLIPKQPCLWGLLIFFDEDEKACNFTDQIDSLEGIKVLEYLDRNTVKVIDRYKQHMSAISELPEIPEDAKALIYVELEGESEDELEEMSMTVIEQCEENGGDSDLIWAMSGEAETEALRAYRHCASECVNMVNAENAKNVPGITKISADITWKNKSRCEILDAYRKDLEESGLEYCIFGHIGTFNPYVNIMASTLEEYAKGRELLLSWEKGAYEAGGSLFKEHGVGKLKKNDFDTIYSQEEKVQISAELDKWSENRFFNPDNKMN